MRCTPDVLWAGLLKFFFFSSADLCSGAAINIPSTEGGYVVVGAMSTPSLEEHTLRYLLAVDVPLVGIQATTGWYMCQPHPARLSRRLATWPAHIEAQAVPFARGVEAKRR